MRQNQDAQKPAARHWDLAKQVIAVHDQDLHQQDADCRGRAENRGRSEMSVKARTKGWMRPSKLSVVLSASLHPQKFGCREVRDALNTNKQMDAAKQEVHD